MATPFSVLTRNRDFRRLFAAELVVFGSDWFVMVPLLVLLPELTGSGVWGALVLAADTGINALLLPYTGTIADRLDRRTILIIANVAALLAILLLFFVRSAATAPLAVVAIGAVAIAKAFYSPAASAALPNVVEPADLAAANAVAGSAWGTMTIVGASLGGIVSSAFGPYVSFAVASVSLLAAAVLTALIRRPLQAPRDPDVVPPRAWPALIEALRYIGARPRLRALVTVKSAVGLGNGVLTVFPLLAGMYGVGALGAGLLFAVRGAGALVGPLVMRPVLNHRSWLLPGLALSMSLYGLGYIGVAFAPWFPLVLALVFVAHFAGGTNWVLSNYALQGEVPDRLRGRVFATDMMLATLAISVSQLGAAAVVDRVDERVILIGCGLITLIYAIGWRFATRHLSLADSTAEPVASTTEIDDPATAGPAVSGNSEAGDSGAGDREAVDGSTAGGAANSISTAGINGNGPANADGSASINEDSLANADRPTDADVDGSVNGNTVGTANADGLTNDNGSINAAGSAAEANRRADSGPSSEPHTEDRRPGEPVPEPKP